MYSPFEVIEANLVQHAPHYSGQTSPVIRMMAESISLLGERDGLMFAHGLVKGLDIYGSREAFGPEHKELAWMLGDMVLDPETLPTHRYGALAVASAMGLIYGFEATRYRPGADVQGARSIATIGHALLYEVRQDTNECFADLRTIAAALLELPPADPEDMAIELLDLPAAVEDVATYPTPGLPEIFFTLSGDKHPYLISPAFTMPRDEVVLNEETIGRMDWIKDPNAQTFTAHTIAADDERVAYLLDLTMFNRRLHEIASELARNKSAYALLQRTLAMSIINYTRNPAFSRRMQSPHQKLPVYCSSTQGSNDRLTRAYYTPVGKHKDGTPVVALLAASRSKDRERTVLSIITRQTYRKARV